MITRQLGTDGPEISCIGLGAWPIGGGMGQVNENTAMIKATITDPEKMENVMSERIPEISPKLGLEHEIYTLTKMNNE